MCESRGQFGSSDKPRVVPWVQSVISKWTGFSRIAAAVLLPRRLLGPAEMKEGHRGALLFNLPKQEWRLTLPWVRHERDALAAFREYEPICPNAHAGSTAWRDGRRPDA
jgi:hypothetical protein